MAGQVLLLHFDGTNGSTSFPDSSPSNHLMTANGNAQLDTSRSKFGTASLLCDGSGDFITGDSGGDFGFGTGDFTVDFWYQANSVTSQQVFINFSGASGTSDYLVIYMISTSTLQTFNTGGGSTSGSTVLTVGPWNHIAYTRASGNGRLFLNGNQEGSTASDTSNYAVQTAPVPTIGADNGGPNSVNGWIDEFRILKGVAAWTANFTPPTSPYASEVVPAPLMGQIWM